MGFFQTLVKLFRRIFHWRYLYGVIVLVDCDRMKNEHLGLESCHPYYLIDTPQGKKKVSAGPSVWEYDYPFHQAEYSRNIGERIGVRYWYEHDGRLEMATFVPAPPKNSAHH